MAEILDNQEVTTDILNNIAVDLGATAFSGLTANKFGVDELNNITKEIVGKGITQGGNQCRPYLSGGDLYISTGVIIFSSGAKIRITTPQHVTAQASTYIYALNDTSRNIAEIVATAERPATGDYVMLAYLDENKTLTDLREYAQAKIALLAAPAIYTTTFSLPGGGTSDETLLTTITPSNLVYNCAILYSPGYENKQAFCGFVDFSSGTAFSSLCRYTYESGFSNGYNAFSQSRTDGRILAGIESCTGAQNWHYLYLRPVMTSSGTVEIYKQLVRTSIGGSMSAYTRTVTIILC